MEDIALTPAHQVELVAARIQVAMAPVAAAGCKTPFNFGGEAEVLASQLVQPRDELLAVIPGDVVLGAGVVSDGGAHDGSPQFVRHFGLADAEIRHRARDSLADRVGPALNMDHHERDAVHRHRFALHTRVFPRAPHQIVDQGSQVVHARRAVIVEVAARGLPSRCQRRQQGGEQDK